MGEFDLGIIEGFFGASWPWDMREAYARSLRRIGYDSYIYAPKDDKYLRREWTSDWPDAELDRLKRFATELHHHQVKFGIGLSPFEAYKDYSAALRQRLIEKVRLIEHELSPDIFCILFDDMRGDTPRLAATQLRMIEDVAASTTARRIIMCPTYYSTDPVLERVFGAMPADYLETLGRSLDARVDVFWTGPKVCSSEYPRDHLEAVAQKLARRPFLWDNYPVNDSRAMSAFLHLRAFRNRPSSLREMLAGHAVNPMKQPALSEIPLSTLPMSYAHSEHYHPTEAWRVAARRICGHELAGMIEADLPLFQDVGLDRLSAEQREELVNRYRGHDTHRTALEILHWLNGDYAFDPACLTD